MLIAGNIAKLRNLLQTFHQLRNPLIQNLLFRGVEGILILRAADAIFNRQILHRLQVELDSINLSEFGLQSPDDFTRIDLSFFEGLQGDLYATAVNSGVKSIHSDERGDVLHRIILKDDFGQFLLFDTHGREGDRFRSLGDAENHAGVLDGEKAFVHDAVEVNSGP